MTQNPDGTYGVGYVLNKTIDELLEDGSIQVQVLRPFIRLHGGNLGAAVGDDRVHPGSADDVASSCPSVWQWTQM